MKVNDLVVRFANVNGTGSASANFLFTKAIFRMGIPVTPKNIFPSNIQGLPTWYEVRVSEAAHLGRREGIDLMVCVNPQSMAKDVASVRPGGWFLYDSTKPLAPSYHRDDINYLPIPLMEMCNREYTDPRQRQLFKNIIYVGALAALLDIEFSVLEGLVGDQFKGKEKLIEPNIRALTMGADYARENFECPLPIRVERRDLIGDAIMIDGNAACALGALYAGATVVAWYPITPSTSVAEKFESYAAKYRTDPETGERKYAVVQAEDELAAIGVVIGAAWNGARSFTATSGPGVSLMNEFLGLAYFSEIPTVLIDVQRAGPSTGMPTRTQQSDILLAAYASHGDTKNVLIFPGSPRECFDLTVEAFDLADRLQTPVIIMSDLDLGMNDHVTRPFEWDPARRYDHGKVLTAKQLEVIYGMSERPMGEATGAPQSNGNGEKTLPGDLELDTLTNDTAAPQPPLEQFRSKFGRYLDVDGDGIPYRTIPGTHPSRGAYVVRGTSRDEYAVYTEDNEAYRRNMERLLVKWDTAKELVPAPEFYGPTEGDRSGVPGAIFFGTSTYAAKEAVEMLAAEGIAVDAMRARAFPFGKAFRDFVDAHDRIFVIEQNRDAQFRSLMMIELGTGAEKLISVLNYDGTPITADNIARQIKGALSAGEVQI